MKPEAQRIAIAEACGWIINHEPPYIGMAWEQGTPENWRTHQSARFHTLPDYLNDLNAMHEAEKVLDLGQRTSFIRDLVRLLGVTSAEFRFVHATAAQRAEAFLRTISRWEDPPAQRTEAFLRTLGKWEDSP